MKEFNHPVELPIPSGDNIVFGEGIVKKILCTKTMRIK